MPSSFPSFAWERACWQFYCRSRHGRGKMSAKWNFARSKMAFPNEIWERGLGVHDKLKCSIGRKLDDVHPIRQRVRSGFLVEAGSIPEDDVLGGGFARRQVVEESLGEFKSDLGHEGGLGFAGADFQGAVEIGPPVFFSGWS